MATYGAWTDYEVLDAAKMDARVSALSGPRNRIINGDFAVNQRAFTSTTTSATYGLDRWLMQKVGGTVTYSAQTPALGDLPESARAFARIVASGQAAAGDLAILSQRIESVRTLSGKTVAVSFWAKASTGTPKVAVELEQSFGTGGSPSAPVNTYAGQVTLSTTWTRYTLTVTLPSIAGKTLGSAGDDRLALNLWTSAGSTYNSRTGTLGLQAATIDFWGVQVEAGSVATTFEQRTYADELRACQRYYWRNTASGVTLFSGAGMCTTSTGAVFAFQHPVVMRATPSIDASSGASMVITDGISLLATNPSLAVTSYGNATMTWVTASVASGLTVRWPVALATSGAGPFVGFAAEL